MRVRPNARVTGFERATVGAPAHVAGRGTGNISLQVVNSAQVRANHRYKLEFTGSTPDVVHATAYTLTDSTADSLLFRTGNDFTANARGPVGDGILPIVFTNAITTVDTTYFEQGSPTNTLLSAIYEPGRPVELRRPGFPENLVVRFDSTIVDTGASFNRLRPGKPAKVRVFAATDTGETQMEFFFTDGDNNGTLSLPDDASDVLTRPAGDSLDAKDFTWRVQLDLAGPGARGPLVPPSRGDVWHMQVAVPFEAGDTYAFTTRAETAPVVSAGTAHPYAVPNPYMAAASFEPALFNIKGRGERRIEFRDIARGATIRIYTVHGDLVRTLRHDGSFDGFVAWDLRTKDDLDVAPGLYLYNVEAPGQTSFTGKLAVVK